MAAALRRPGLAFAVVVAVLAADVSATGVKHAVGRQRPEQGLDGIDVLVPTPHSQSFPSGHTATSFAAAVVLSVAVPPLAPVFLLLAMLVGFSRMYVGAHYPLDVAAGAALGATVATALLLLSRGLRRSRSRLTRVPPTGR